MKAAKTTSLRRRIHCDVICHTTARRRSWQLSPDSDIGPSDLTLPGHSWGQYLVGTIPRSIRICVPNLVMIGPAVWPPILDRQTHRQNLYYIDIDKLQLMAPDTIVQLCASFFSEADIDSAKLLLFDLCADQDDRQDRMIKRASGPKKKQLSLKDIVSLFTCKHDAITARVTFVAVDLGKLPPIGYNSLDVCTLLSQLQTTISELETVKVTVAAQAVTCSELRSSAANQQWHS